MILIIPELLSAVLTLKGPGAPARGNATAKTYDIVSAMAGDRRRKHAVYIKSFIRRCGELVEGCLIAKKGLHPTQLFCRHLGYVLPFRGAFEQIYREYKNPYAVDAVHSYFGDLVDKHSYYSLDRWNGASLREMSDGYIVPCGIDEMQPVGLVPDWVTTPTELEEVKNVLSPAAAAGINDISALAIYLEADNPQRSQIREIARLGAR